MSTWNTILVPEKLDKALEQLEVLANPRSLRIIDHLREGGHQHLPELSQHLQTSPYQIKTQVDQLKAGGFIFSPKRYPKAYALNTYRWIKIRMASEQLAAGYQPE